MGLWRSPIDNVPPRSKSGNELAMRAAGVQRAHASGDRGLLKLAVQKADEAADAHLAAYKAVKLR